MSVLVVGGGVAGLTAAWHLLSTGTPASDITVLESSPRVGGKLARAEVAGRLVDIGAESMLALRPEARELIEEIGLGDALTVPATTSASIWSRDRLWPLPTGTLMGVPVDPESVRGVLTDAEVARLADEQPWPEPLTDDIAVGEYLAHRLGDAVVDRLVEPLLGGVYAASARRLSMAAAVPMLYAVARDGGSVTGAAAKAAAARSGTRSGSSAFIGLTGGGGRLPEHLRAVLVGRGVTVETGVTVRELTATGSPGRPQWEATCGAVPTPAYRSADAVVLAAPPPAAARLLAPLAPVAGEILGGIDMASMAIVTLAVERRGADLPGSGFLVPDVDGRTIKASTFSSGKWAWVDALDEDLVFLRASIGRAGDVTALQWPDADLVDVAVREVGEAVGAPLPRVVDSHVQRWGGGLPQYAVGHLGRIAQVEAAVAGVPGLEVCGAAYGGVGIPAVIASARVAAERLTRGSS